MNGFDYNGKTVLVTGGTRASGGASPNGFAAGARVFVCGRSAPDTPPADGSRTVTFVAADLRDIEQVDAMLATIRAAAGRLDVLVNNAGGSPFALAADASPRFTESIVRLNLIAPLQLAQRVNAIMQPQPEGGVMLFIASVSASRPSPGTAAYGAAKAGLVNAVTSLAVEWAPRVRVRDQPEPRADRIGRRRPLRRRRCARRHSRDDSRRPARDTRRRRRRVPVLASPDASYTSGANPWLDGGGERPAFLTAAQAAAR